MKPSPGDFPTVEGGRKTSIRQLIYSTVVFASVCICVAHAFARVEAWLGGSGERSDQGGIAGTWSWEEIQPTEDLQFHSCREGFECAKLKLPLDYFNGTYPSSSISLALIKLPARVPVDDPRYGGPILVNPGGPGGDGVSFLRAIGPLIQIIVDSAEDINSFQDSSPKYYDIVSFDPRGIGLTEPAARCMPDAASWWSWQLRMSSQGIPGSSDAALGRLWSMLHAWGSSCKSFSETQEGPDIKRYMTTASVARDMLEIAERHAAYVAKRINPRIEQSELVSHIAETKVQYWGFSYGTYLGYTFASMFPDRVGRFVLDGVVNSDDYNHNYGNGSIHDAEKAMASFYTFCLQAGPEECPLASPTAAIEDLNTRVQNITKSLYHSPLSVPSIHGPEVLTYTDLQALFFVSLYSPPILFPRLAEILLAIETRDEGALKQYPWYYQIEHVYQCRVNSTPRYDLDVPEFAVLCADGDDVSNGDMASFEEYWREMAKTSPTMGPIWSLMRMRCMSWKIRAAYRYTGDFSAETNNPILFISNTADPVTPLRSGRIMHERFPGSVLLVQDSSGHISITTPTPCTISHIRSYFQTLTLPKPGTVCVPPPSPFSLNSTDPGSPFYEPSLGKSYKIFDSGLDRNTRVEEKAVDAAKALQRWISDRGAFWGMVGSKADMARVRGILGAS